jgi:hypothetical protein
MWEYRRWPLVLQIGCAAGSGLYVSYNGGETWESAPTRMDSRKVNSAESASRWLPVTRIRYMHSLKQKEKRPLQKYRHRGAEMV